MNALFDNLVKNLNKKKEKFMKNALLVLLLFAITIFAIPQAETKPQKGPKNVEKMEANEPCVGMGEILLVCDNQYNKGFKKVLRINTNEEWIMLSTINGEATDGFLYDFELHVAQSNEGETLDVTELFSYVIAFHIDDECYEDLNNLYFTKKQNKGVQK